MTNETATRSKSPQNGFKRKLNNNKNLSDFVEEMDTEEASVQIKRVKIIQSTFFKNLLLKMSICKEKVRGEGGRMRTSRESNIWGYYLLFDLNTSDFQFEILNFKSSTFWDSYFIFIYNFYRYKKF